MKARIGNPLGVGLNFGGECLLAGDFDAGKMVDFDEKCPGRAVCHGGLPCC